MAASNKIQVGYIEAQDGAQFEIDAGTAAAPGLCFDDSAATGLYSPGTGQIAWSTSGKQTALRILADGKVGIDCSPTVALEVNGTIKASAIEAPIEGTLDDWIVHAGDTDTKFGFPGNDEFQVFAGGGPKLKVSSAGVVDINNAAGQSHYQITQASGNTVKMGIVSGSDFEISGSSNNNIIFKRAGSTRLTITTDGATVAPNLTANSVLSSYGGIQTKLGFISGGAEGFVGTISNHSLFIKTNDTNRIKIANNSAATAIGTNAAFNAMLTVRGDISGALLALKATEDTNRLMVSGNDTSGCEVNLYDDTGGQRGILGVSSGEFFIKAPNSSAPMTFWTHNGSSLAKRLKINSAGDVLLGTHQATIGMDTADGSDNQYWSLSGGSDASQSRGAVITIYGNESANADNLYGTLSLKSGNTTTGMIDFWTQGAKKAEITKEGCFRIQSTYNGSSHTSNAYPCLNITNLQGTYTANNILGGVTFGKAAGHSNGVRAGMLAIYQGSGNAAGNVGAHLSFWTSGNATGDGKEKLFISDTGVLCTGNYRGILDSTMGSIQINGGDGTNASSGGRLSFRGTTTSQYGGLGEIHGFWDTNKVASILFHGGASNSNKDDGEIRMYTRPVGGGGQERLRIKADGNIIIKDHLSIDKTGFETLTGNGVNAKLQVNCGTNDYDGIMIGSGYNRSTITTGGNYDLVLTSNAYPANATSKGIRFLCGSSGGGGPSERMQITPEGIVKFRGVLHSNQGTNTTSASITPANNQWITFASVSYSHGVMGEVYINWKSIQAPSCCYHGDAQLRIGGNHFTYHYGWESTLELISCQAHNSAWFRSWRLIKDGSVLKLQGRWAGSTVQSGTFYVNVTRANTNPQTTAIISAITPVVENSLSGTVQAQIDGQRDDDDPPDGGGSYIQHAKYGIIHSRRGLDTKGWVTAVNQPSFHVGSPNVAGGSAGSAWRCHANAIFSNKGSHYDNSNGRFTAPISGHYHFFMYCMSSSSHNSTTDVYSRLNGSRDQIMTAYNGNGNSTGGYHNMSAQCNRWLDSGDYVDIYTSTGSLYNGTDGRHGGWGGFLIG